MFKDYSEAYNYFYGKENHFMDFGLDNIKNFLEKIGQPQETLKIIQIAGTNGKGSVSAFMTEILMEAGYRVGRYNSPVVFEEGENITINNIPMSREKFLEQVEQLYGAMEESDKIGRLPTIFELETAMAINYFAKEGCDLVILEAGLGGKNDGTNVSLTNVEAVITSVSLDHMQYLGNTVEEIAKVKAGIVKKGSAVVCGKNQNTVTNIIKRAAEENQGRYYGINQEDIILKGYSLDGQTFSYRTSGGILFEDLFITLLGDNQVENGVTAVEAVMALKDLGFKVSFENIRDGLRKTKWRGRFQIISKNPIIVIDGAHNIDGVKRLMENLEKYLKDYKKVFIMGIFADKDYRGIIRQISPMLQNVIGVEADSKRALPVEKLAEAVREYSKAVVYEAYDYGEALSLAEEISDDKTAVVAFGSLSYLRHIRKAEKLG